MGEGTQKEECGKAGTEKGRIENPESQRDHVGWSERKNPENSGTGQLALRSKCKFNKGFKNQQQ